jgi:hypothetical protein
VTPRADAATTLGDRQVAGGHRHPVILMLAFMRACFSPPQLPPPKPGNSDAGQQAGDDTLRYGTLPPGY